MKNYRRAFSFFSILLAINFGALSLASDAHCVRIGQFPQEVATSFSTRKGLSPDDIHAVFCSKNGPVYAQTAEGWAVLNRREWKPVKPPRPAELIGYVDPGKYDGVGCRVNQAAQGPEGRLVMATEKGLLEKIKTGFEPILIEDGLGRCWGTSDVRGVAFDSTGRLWFATLAGVGCLTTDGWRFYTGQEGLPYNDITMICPGPSGVVWFGTHLGAIRFDDGQWAYRQGPRWLPDDDIRNIAVDADGNAWFATAKGVGLIERQTMTLAEKAEFFEDEIERYIKRTPFGYVAPVYLVRPGDKSKITRCDDDNDGLWTAMYGAGECYCYAATGKAKAKERAKKVFEAIRFLQEIPKGSEHEPPKGYVARTIRSTDLPDPNEGRIERDRKRQANNDSLWKVYEPRWPKSADGRWYWKSDTSSDELDGHYFFYPLYYDLVADTKEEKERVQTVVRDLTDHLIDHNFNIVDHDGTPTRWGIYGPEHLNHNPNWWPERGLKSLSILSYLTVAEHITGDAKYRLALEKLRKNHAYDANAIIYKIHQGIGTGNQSDDEMAFMCYYNLVRYTKDPKLRSIMTLGFYYAWMNEAPEMNPFFNFAYAACGLNATFATPWGVDSLAPWKGWLDDSIKTLMGIPLDRLNWPCKNSHRLDLIKLPQQPPGPSTLRPLKTGYQVSGKVLPVENRIFEHWNASPWDLDYGGDGRRLAAGTVYLLPYYMGLYHGFIEEVD
jgi:two component regulator with propeller domain